VRTVELLPDDDLESLIRAVWDRLDAAGVSSMARHRHATNRPHLTLASAPALPDLGVHLAVLPLTVTLDGLVRFDGRAGVLAWRVRPEEPLLELQRQIWAAVADDNPQHAPDRWQPHITLARHTAPAATDLLAGLPPATGRFVAARSYDSETRTVTGLAEPPATGPGPSPPRS
jgi:2'-5' RNA ligase